MLKRVTVFRALDRCAVGTDDLHAAVHQRLCQVDGRLSAEGSDDAFRLFEVDDRHDVFRRKRIKVQLVGGSIICRDGLRVIVDDDCFTAGTADRLYSMNRGVIKLYALSDTDRACAEGQDLALIAETGLVFSGIGAVEVCDVLAGMERVHHAEDRRDAVFLSLMVDRNLVPVPELRDVLIRKAHLLRFLQHADVAGMCRELCFHIHDLFDGLQE